MLDGELLVVRDGEVAPFNDLQQRLGRKTVSAAARARYPCHVKLYDILMEDGADLRPLPLAERRRRLEAWFERYRPERMDLSPLVAIDDWETLSGLRASTRAAGIEGLMLKRKDSAYVAGRPKGPWFKLKRDPLIVDCVLMYAQRGHGKRSSFYSDFTFGCWRDDAEASPGLVPVGKAYFGFTDKELAELDRWVRANTVERFGPVRAVSPGLVLEIAFEFGSSARRATSPAWPCGFPAFTAFAGTNRRRGRSASRRWRASSLVDGRPDGRSQASTTSSRAYRAGWPRPCS